MTQGQFLSVEFKQVSIQSFSSPRLVASPRLKNTVFPTIYPIAGERIFGFIPFPRVLGLCGNAISLIQDLKRIAMFISYDDNHYTTGTSSSIQYQQELICHKAHNLASYSVIKICFIAFVTMLG